MKPLPSPFLKFTIKINWLDWDEGLMQKEVDASLRSISGKLLLQVDEFGPISPNRQFFNYCDGTFVSNTDIVIRKIHYTSTKYSDIVAFTAMSNVIGDLSYSLCWNLSKDELKRVKKYGNLASCKLFMESHNN